MRLFTLLFFSALLISACNPQAESSNDTTSAADQPEIPAFFKKVLDAHGGLEQWKKQKSLTFDKGDVHTIDLINRNEVIRKEGVYTLGFNGDKMWIAPNRDSFPGQDPRFYRNLHFYFFALPFVLADPGVLLEKIEDKAVDGKNYEVIKATFGDGVGDAPEDQYLLYLDPETSQLRLINYSVTYFEKENATRYNALVYQWQEVDGLLVPARYTGYKWEDGTLGQQRYQANFEKVKFSGQRPAAAVFEAPDGAWTE